MVQSLGIVSVSDESINNVLLPNHGPGSPGAATTQKEYPMPKEYATPIGNRSTFAYIQGKIKTYKTFLKKHKAKFWKQAPLKPL